MTYSNDVKLHLDRLTQLAKMIDADRAEVSADVVGLVVHDYCELVDLLAAHRVDFTMWRHELEGALDAAAKKRRRSR